MCEGQAYLIPGDVVETAVVCNGYTHVKYYGKSTFHTGWVDSGYLRVKKGVKENVPCEANQLTLNECAERDFKAAEANMNKVLDALRQKLKGTESEKLLRESQDSWLKFTEADCRYDVSGLTPDGSILGEVLNECRTSHTKDRTRQLEQFSHCESAGCPGQLR